MCVVCCRGLGHSPGAPDGKFLHKQLCGQETPPQSLPFDIHWQLLLRCKSHRPRQHFNLLPTIKVSAGITVPDTVNLPVPELFSFPAGCCWTPSAAAATPPPCSREDRHLGPHLSHNYTDWSQSLAVAKPWRNETSLSLRLSNTLLQGLQMKSHIPWPRLPHATAQSFSLFLTLILWVKTYLVVQWLRIHLAMHGMWVQPLLRELRSHVLQGN